MLTNILFILIGFVLLVKGGDYLVEGSVSIARKAKLSSMVIGMTVIGFGTSAPEMLVSVNAALADSPGIALGNVVGSNIANIALILGVTGLLYTCVTDSHTLRVDLPFMVLACVLLLFVGMMGSIGRIAGILGILLLVAFLIWQIRASRRKGDADVPKTEDTPVRSLPVSIIMVVLSIAAMIVGANILVDGAKNVAAALGVSERVIGLTVVAVGTSLPELFASVMSAKRGETDLAIGNIIGSVSFNVFFVVGVSAAISPIMEGTAVFFYDYLLMVGLAVLLWLFLFTKRTLERWEGAVLLLTYVAYIAHMVWTL
ncbi:MAG: calcium/sodium antiporter [Paludibacteraceae bacterium]|nr:calcium/sodium antiporter [Paludibacteraceae bacterium]MCR5498696.1 calcium/sodium antiporter [Paludibacteraceae bacterium]